ncbi:MAG: ABC transporter transmembrane domain-containing protein [Bacteroidia bacterium]
MKKKKSPTEKALAFCLSLRYKNFSSLSGIAAGSLLQLLFPFLTQSIVDVGIQNQDISFIYLVLLAQLFLFIGKMGIQMIRGWILLHPSTASVCRLLDFFIKLMKLPIAYFDVKMVGDIMQRVSTTSASKSSLPPPPSTSCFPGPQCTAVCRARLLQRADIPGLFAGSLLYFGWVVVFLKTRRAGLQIFCPAQWRKQQGAGTGQRHGVPLHNAERQKRWGWNTGKPACFGR